MRLFHMIDSLRIGGSEGQLIELARRQAESGIELEIGCLQLKGQIEGLPDCLRHTIREFPVSGSIVGPAGVKSILRLARYLRSGGFDVVHTHDLYANLIGVPAAFLARVPGIVSSRRDLASWWWYTRRNRWILRKIQSMSDVVLANSEGVRRFLVEQDGFRPGHVAVVRNGVEMARFDVRASRAELFPGVAEGTFVVAMVANMHTNTKGHLVLIEAIRQLSAEEPNLVIVLAGDGEMRRDFESKVSGYGLDKYFRFLGARGDIPQILAASNAGLLASHAEGLPNSLLEYMAAGKLAIGTAVGGIPEVIQDRLNGLLVKPDSPDDLAAAIRFALQKPDLVSRMAANGQELMRNQYTFEVLLQETSKLYARAMKS